MVTKVMAKFWFLGFPWNIVNGLQSYDVDINSQVIKASQKHPEITLMHINFQKADCKLSTIEWTLFFVMRLLSLYLVFYVRFQHLLVVTFFKSCYFPKQPLYTNKQHSLFTFNLRLASPNKILFQNAWW